ncbi:MAG: hypothetical protein H6620_06085 [Halobacteriovoraceae bacterium]|nr:hypothetical protein [Halobacteriovoraceae bacterium]
MKKAPVMLALMLGSSLSFGATSSNTIEGSIEEAAPAKKASPLKINLNTSYQSNPDEIHDVEVGVKTKPLYEDVIIQRVGAEKSFSLGDLGRFETTYTPSLTASFLDSKNLNNKDDTVKSADIMNNLKLQATEGSIQYGMTLDANYHSGYTYKYRNRYENGNPVSVGFQKRYDNNANGAVGVFANVGITNNWIVENSVNARYEDYYHEKNPHYREAVAGVHSGYATGFSGDTYDRLITGVGVTNKFLLDEVFSVAVPLNYTVVDYSNYSAYYKDWNGDNTATRLLEETSVGVALNASTEIVSGSVGATTGRINDKRQWNIEDADHNIIDSSISVSPMEKVSIAASHKYEEIVYDFEPQFNNERYNTYSLGLTYSFDAVDATLGHGISKGQCNFGTGVYENASTSLDLNFKL